MPLPESAWNDLLTAIIARASFLPAAHRIRPCLEDPEDWADPETIATLDWPDAEAQLLEALRADTVAKIPDLPTPPKPPPTQPTPQ